MRNERIKIYLALAAAFLIGAEVDARFVADRNTDRFDTAQYGVEIAYRCGYLRAMEGKADSGCEQLYGVVHAHDVELPILRPKGEIVCNVDGSIVFEDIDVTGISEDEFRLNVANWCRTRHPHL